MHARAPAAFRNYDLRTCCAAVYRRAPFDFRVGEWVNLSKARAFVTALRGASGSPIRAMPSVATSPIRSRSMSAMSPESRVARSSPLIRRTLFTDDTENSTPQARRASWDTFDAKDSALATRIEQRSASAHGQQLLAAAAAFERAALTMQPSHEPQRIGMYKLADDCKARASFVAAQYARRLGRDP